MTCEEFSREFDILYNNITSNQAPGLSEYEKSVFLTQAQESIVLEMYSEKFEETEDVTSYLSALVKSDTVEYTSDGCTIKPEAWFIVREEVTIGDNTIPVVPTTQDEYNRIKNNPFRRANIRRVLRLTTSDGDTGGRKAVLIIANNSGPYELGSFIGTFEEEAPQVVYKYWFVRRPKPIVTAELSVAEYGTLTTIDNDLMGTTGDTVPPQSCELSPALHRTILARAVQIAKSVWTSK